jgi:hypothetical protein
MPPYVKDNFTVVDETQTNTCGFKDFKYQSREDKEKEGRWLLELKCQTGHQQRRFWKY